MALDTERVARRLVDAGLGERAATGVADTLADATDGLATQASMDAGFAELRADAAEREARIYRALWIQGAGLIGAILAVGGIILAAMRLWM